MLLLSCNALKYTYEGNVKNDILGEWTIQNIKGRSCHSCPVISFNKDGKGEMIKPSNEDYIFTYNLREDILFITFKGSLNILNEGKFSYKFEKSKREIVLLLNPLETQDGYILVKQYKRR